ncbi:Rv3235 family protein [Nocardia jejuensis]|uniref:Rv3235 family protein n=1 Tax=Nocardia jejuensis TaxID=328049 RepID=UPI000B0490F8|nr:Rv3235 family protein [Nocardia jejuensis]
MASEGEFLRLAPESEPPLAPCRPGRAAATPPRSRAAGGPLAEQVPPSRNTVSGRSGTVVLQRVLRASHAAKARTPSACGEPASAARQFAGMVVRVALEVLDGRRPAAQLRLSADPAVIAALGTLVAAGAPGRAHGVATLTRLDVMMSAPGIGEVCAGYDRGTRHFALAARIVRGRSGWRLTAFRVC